MQLLLLPLLPATSGKHFRHLGAVERGRGRGRHRGRGKGKGRGRGRGRDRGRGNLCAASACVCSLSLGGCGTQLPVLNTKDTARTLPAHLYLPLPPSPSFLTSLSLVYFLTLSFFHSIRVSGVKNLRIKFPYQPFYLQQFGNTFVWHSPPPHSRSSLSPPPPQCAQLFSRSRLGLAVTYQFPLDCIKKRKPVERGRKQDKQWKRGDGGKRVLGTAS